jgi:hypothetical protein
VFGYPDKETIKQVNAKDLYLDPLDCADWCAIVEKQGYLQGHELQMIKLSRTCREWLTGV